MRNSLHRILLVLTTLWFGMSVSAESITVFFGTYTGGESKGIYKCRMDQESGALSELQLAATTVNPSFLAIHPSGDFLYAVGETDEFEGKKTGSVSAFKIDSETHGLTLLNRCESGGANPCHLVVDKTGKFVLVANYSGGSVASIAINDDGSLGEQVSFHQHEGSSVNAQRQEAPHAHSVNLDAANKYAFVADLGVDKILIYSFDEKTGKLVPNEPASVSVPGGSGPRHFAFHPGGKLAFSNNEMLLSVNAFQYDAAKGALQLLDTVSTVPEGTPLKGNSTAETLVHPNGKFVYVSNRGHDSIAVFQLDVSSGSLTRAEIEPSGGKTPRNFAIEPSGKFLLSENHNTNDVVVFRIDPSTGVLESTGHTLAVPSPVCAKFLK